MNPRTLAKALRRRQLRKGLAPKSSINALSDPQILDAYVCCSKCSGELFEDRAAAVAHAASVEEFLQLVDMAIATHQCQNQN